MKSVWSTLLSLFSMPASASGLVDEYPQTDQVTLSTGEVVRLPLQVRRASGVVLAGLADLQKLDAALNSEGLQAVPITSQKGLVLFFGMNYTDGTLGPYQELVIQVLSTPKSEQKPTVLKNMGDLSAAVTAFIPFINNSTDGIHRKTPFFMWKLFVTTKLALDAGREIWGYPKDLAQVDVLVTSEKSSFKVKSDSGEIVAAEKNHQGSLTLPVSIDMRMISPKEFKSLSSRGMAKSMARLEFFDNNADVFKLNEATEWGANLKKADFQPLLWIVMPQLEAVFFKP